MDLLKEIKTLQNIVSRKGSSKILTFSTPHVFKALQLLSKQKFVSRSLFGKELHLGEGAVKTLINHLKESEMVNTAKAGTFLTKKGQIFAAKFTDTISNECKMQKTSLTKGKHSHAVILRGYSKAVKTGLEQRDFAIMYGATGAVTLLFKNKKFVFPGEEKDVLENDTKTKKILYDELEPKEKDIIIITTSDDSFVSEVSAKNSALWTIATFEQN